MKVLRRRSRQQTPASTATVRFPDRDASWLPWSCGQPLSQAEKRKHRQDNDDQAHQINQPVHFSLQLRWPGRPENRSGQRTVLPNPIWNRGPGVLPHTGATGALCWLAPHDALADARASIRQRGNAGERRESSRDQLLLVGNSPGMFGLPGPNSNIFLSTPGAIAEIGLTRSTGWPGVPTTSYVTPISPSLLPPPRKSPTIGIWPNMLFSPYMGMKVPLMRTWF